LKAEIRLEKVAAIGVATSLQDGVLMGKITCTVPVTPFSIARLLNFQKQHGVLNLIVESPQAVMDFELLDPKQTEGTVQVKTVSEPVQPAAVKFADIKWGADRPGEEGGTVGGPAVYKFQIDGFTGEGPDVTTAILAALASGGIIAVPVVEGATPDYSVALEEALKVLKEKYSDNVNAARVALALQKNSFILDGTEITFSNNGAGEGQEPPGPGEQPVKGKRGRKAKQLAAV